MPVQRALSISEAEEGTEDVISKKVDALLAELKKINNVLDSTQKYSK